MTREEIIKGVKGCVGMYYGFRCGECPYGPYNSDCVASLHRDVELLMEAQTPRVLDLSEIPEHDGAVFIEYKRGDEDWALYIDEMQHRVVTTAGILLKKEYGIEWRAWTGRPTPEQRWQNA